MIAPPSLGTKQKSERECVVQIASTGILSLTYFHRLNDKHSLAADFLLNVNAPQDATASVGYDYFFRQCRLRGCIDSNFRVQVRLATSTCVAAFFFFSVLMLAMHATSFLRKAALIQI
jgi:hypothetical protein